MYTIDKYVETTFLSGKDYDSLTPRPGLLGIGTLGEVQIIGEVVLDQKPIFTLRSRVLNNLDIPHVCEFGYVLSSQQDFVSFIPADLTQKAFEELGIVR